LFDPFQPAPYLRQTTKKRYKFVINQKVSFDHPARIVAVTDEESHRAEEER